MCMIKGDRGEYKYISKSTLWINGYLDIGQLLEQSHQLLAQARRRLQPFPFHPCVISISYQMRIYAYLKSGYGY